MFATDAAVAAAAVAVAAAADTAAAANAAAATPDFWRKLVKFCFSSTLPKN